MQKYSARECEVFNNMLHDFNSIDGDSMLEERGLEWDDFKRMGIEVDTLRFKKEVYTRSERVAKYFGSFGMTVTSYVTEWRAQL